MKIHSEICIKHFFRTNFSPEDSHMSDIFSAYWGNFAATGDPSLGTTDAVDGLTSWPAYVRKNSLQSWQEKQCCFFCCWELVAFSSGLKLTLKHHKKGLKVYVFISFKFMRSDW